MTTGVVAAMPVEARCLPAETSPDPETPPRRAVRVSGAGPQAAATAARELLTEGATRLLSWGIAGGLDPALRPGTLFLPDSLAGDPCLVCDRSWRDRVRARLAPAMDIAEGPLASSEAPLTSLAGKREARRRWAARAVDQESRAVAATARAAGVPFLAVRAIADPEGRALPPGIAACLRSDGSPDLPALLRTLLEDPRAGTTLPGLALDLLRARRTLARTARLLGPGL